MNDLNTTNGITLSFAYECENTSRILEYVKNYNSVLHVLYNRLYEKPSLSATECWSILENLNNIFIDSYFKNGALYEAKALIKRNGYNKVIFGGKKLFIDRCQNKISKEEFQLKKLSPLQIIGAAFNNGNTKFQILDTSTILFKPSRKEHFILKLKNPGKNYQRYLEKLLQAQKDKKLPITYKLGLDKISIYFDLNLLENINMGQKIFDRVIAIDMNPNYIGLSVVDWKASNDFDLIESQVISLKSLNAIEKNLHLAANDPKRKYITNKRNYEITKIAHDIVKLANHYKVQIFSIENIDMKTQNNKKGRNYNRLVNNQWNRNLLERIIKKLCLQNNIEFLSVNPAYSSYQGNLIYRQLKLPDMILASIEIGRRGYEFYHQYIKKDKPIQQNIIFNENQETKTLIEQSLEELNFKESWDSFKDLFYKLKKTRCNYRFPLDDALYIHRQSLLSLNDKRSYKNLYIFI